MSTLPSSNASARKGPLGLPIWNWLFPVLLWVFYFSEAVSKISEWATGHYHPLPRWIKVGVIGFFFLVLIYYKFFKTLKVFAFLLLAFAIANYSLGCDNPMENVVVFGKYLFPIVLLFFFDERVRAAVNLNILYSSFEWLLKFNFVLIIIGLVFQVAIFETYDGPRFGYNGLLLTSSTSTYAYICALLYYCFKFNWRKEVLKDTGFWIVLVSSLLVGTKSLYLAVGMIFAFMVFLVVPPKKRLAFAISVGIIGSGLIYVILNYLDPFKTIVEERGLLSAFLSYRNELVVRDVIPFIQAEWSWVNYLIGGVCDIKSRSEMAIIDVFYYWGILGGCYYLYLFYKHLFSFKQDQYTWFSLLLLFIVITLAGNFFFYSTIPIYILLLRERILTSREES